MPKNMINVRGCLTHYPEGSVQELWGISFPLILSIFSINLMIFLDRLILAKYNTQAMNAAVVAGLVFSVFQLGAIGITSIAEVFVGQYNGAKKLNKMGEPVWQMIWFSVMTSALFIPLGLFAGPLFIPNPDYIADGIPFFKTLMLFGPTFPLVAALSSFFVGRGKVKLVMVTIILSNVLNVILDFGLIFGIEGVIPALGAKGAAIATGTAQTIQAIVLLGVFLRRSHRETNGTGRWHFELKLFFQMLRIGVPNAISSGIDAIAWCVLAQILVSASEAHITVFSIGDSFFSLFAFAFLGLQKGVTTVASNYIGADREEMLSKTFYSGIKIVLAIMLVFTIPLFYFPEVLAQWFLNPETSALANGELKEYIEIAMRWLWVYFLFDAIAWLTCGVLTAAGDTKFIMIMNSVNAWVFSIIPTYFFVSHFQGSPVVSWILYAVYGFLNMVCFFLRYKSKRWSLEQPLHALT